jgi:hypothetical protein
MTTQPVRQGLVQCGFGIGVVRGAQYPDKHLGLGKEMSKKQDTTKAEVARKMFKLIQGESREVIARAFVEGANLTPKVAMTYVYNIRRKLKKSS